MAQKNINLRILGDLTIPVPPLPLQQEFARRVAEIHKMEAGQAAARLRLESLFQSAGFIVRLRVNCEAKPTRRSYGALCPPSLGGHVPVHPASGVRGGVMSLVAPGMLVFLE